MSQQAAGKSQPFSRNTMALGPAKKQTLPKYPPELDTKVRGARTLTHASGCACRRHNAAAGARRDGDGEALAAALGLLLSSGLSPPRRVRRWTCGRWTWRC
jgi:hypothetical protein